MKISIRRAFQILCALSITVGELCISGLAIREVNSVENIAESSYSDALYNGYKLEIKSQIQNAVSVINYFYEQYKDGVLSEDEAKYQAKETVRMMRYRDDKGGYFWIDDQNYVLVMHPMFLKLEGQNRSKLQDQNNFPIVKSIVDSALNGTGTYIEFLFAKPDGMTVAPTLAYSELFKPWGWVVSTRTYRDEIEALLDSEINLLQQKKSLMIKQILVASVILIISGCIVAGLVGANILNPLKNVKNAITDIASGNADLTKRIMIKAENEIGAVARGFNRFAERLQSIISDIKNSQDDLLVTEKSLGNVTSDNSDFVDRINVDISDVQAQIEKQSESVSDTAGAVNEIASNIESLEKLIESQSSGVVQATSSIEEMIANIGSVNTSVEQMSGSFEELLKTSQSGMEKQSTVNEQIKQIDNQSKMLQEANQAILSIAEQTNLLAMNAAIEAAHAGEAGKGFSVVADEIRKLSETSSAQSKTIGDQLNNIKESIERVVSSSDASAVAFSSVSDLLSKTDAIVKNISLSMKEQQEGSKQIVEFLRYMNSITSNVKSASAEMSAGNSAIFDEVKKLQDYTLSVKESIMKMSYNVSSISSNKADLESISSELERAVENISSLIGQFKV